MVQSRENAKRSERLQELIVDYRKAYNKSRKGKELPETPKGWVIVPEGREIPKEHRECIEDYGTGRLIWAGPRRCHSTETPLWACVWGGVRAFATPIVEE